MLRSRFAGYGAYLPKRVITNNELAKRLDTSDEWIKQRTGISQRHVAADGEFTSHLATNAARDAIADAKIGVDDLDLLIVATTTPDNTFPATAARVQAELDMLQGAAFDVQAVCSGFIYALAIADNMIRLGQAATALVVGAETFSRILDWNDRSTCVLFGDGAGAVVLQAAEGDGTNQDRGVLSTHLYSDGRQYDALVVDGGPSTTGTAGHVRMQGREVYRQAVTRMVEGVDTALASNGLTAQDVDWLVPHQANIRIMEHVGEKLGIPSEKTIVTVQNQANTSAATIPLALAQAAAAGRFEAGQIAALTAMGGGFTWGAALVRL